MAHETAEQLRKLLSATVEPLQAEIKRLTATNVRLDALLQKTKESTFIAVDTALLLENLQKRKSYLLQVNRTLCSHVSLAGMDPDILVQAVQVLTAGALNLADLQLDQATFVALQRIQAEAADSSDPCALSTAMVKAVYQVAHGSLTSILDRVVRTRTTTLMPVLTLPLKIKGPSRQIRPVQRYQLLGSALILRPNLPLQSLVAEVAQAKTWKQKKRLKTRLGSQSAARSQSS
ncbi:hypothetical protein PC110_g4310 [Phytophthora cactorum]|nr:hypothetical protein PC110_g4310 [Phytophthora cactorum]